MQAEAPSPDSVRVLRIAAWMWVGYLLAMAGIDSYIYAHAPRSPLALYYLVNGSAASAFLVLSYWDWIWRRLAGFFAPLMLLWISSAPILLHHALVPRFPPGPLANAEGMALRQLPVLFMGLVLVAWQYRLMQVVWFSLGTALLEWIVILGLVRVPPVAFLVFFFITIVRTVSFLVVGLFVSQLMGRLRAQQESLQQANVRLTHFASALENLTVTRERNRMARELHDTLAHTLTGLSVALETVRAYWDVQPARARELLDRSLETTRRGLEETRRALKSLRASPLEDMGLGLALRQLVESAAARSHLDTELALPNPMPALSPDVEQCIYRIAQEAVDNIVHHANAKRLSLRLARDGEGVALVIADDGMGFDRRARTLSDRFGLVGMRERADLVGGSLTVESHLGKGTTVRLKV